MPVSSTGAAFSYPLDMLPPSVKAGESLGHAVSMVSINVRLSPNPPMRSGLGV